MKNFLRRSSLIAALFLSFTVAFASDNPNPPEKKEVTIADIWKDGTFRTDYVSGFRSMKDGAHYTILERKEGEMQISKYSYKSGEFVEAIVMAEDLMFNDKKIRIESYEFSADEKKVLIGSEVESIYRRSTKAYYYIYDLKSKTLEELDANGKQMYADFSPAGNMVAYVRNNNLFYKDLEKKETIIVTSDGVYNKITNGAADWVYEEELELSQAFAWSPDGKKLAYYRFDETNVKQWDMKMYNGLYPDHTRFKYPKAGEENSKVSVHIYHLGKGETKRVKTENDYEYITLIKWNDKTNELIVISSNRHQSKADINLVDPSTGGSKVIYTEKSDTYIEMPYHIYFQNEGRDFIILSEKSGFRHIYRYGMDGKLKKQLTTGDWPVTEYYGANDNDGWVYYQSAEVNPLERHVYRVNMSTGKKEKLSSLKGQNNASFSSSFDYFLNYQSSANTPYRISLHNSAGKEIRVLKDNASLRKKLENYNITKKTFFKFKTAEGEEFNAWMIKPSDFDESKKYPVFVTIYGGPGYQTVQDSWGGSNYFWHQHLAQKGYIVVSVDVRGSGARGAKFKKVTYKQLGKYETMDLIASAKYFATLPYVDGGRIGIQGWSYGGYMSSLCLLKGADQFKMAIAVAPVTNWRFYDSIYTERYMQTPQENPDGYDDNSPINHVDKLKGKYLLVHGTADDNVHFQNTTEMIQALVEADKQFDLFIYPDKNHGIYGGNTRYHLYNKMTNFVLENL